MKSYNLITPEGTRDLLFGECTARRRVEAALCDLFRGDGYSEVVTPFVEFYDVFGGGAFPPESVYKLTDSKGRLIVLRPDSTLPIIRLAETRLKSEPRPLRLCYNQTIYRVNPKESGRDDEIAQCGIEFIADAEFYAANPGSRESLRLAGKTLRLLSEMFNADSHFEIGDCGIFGGLIRLCGIGGDKAAEIKRLMRTKRLPELSEKAAKGEFPAIFAQLPALFGGEEVFAEYVRAVKESGLPEEAATLADGLREVYSAMSAGNGGTAGGLTADLGLTSRRGYYSGLLFNGYLGGYGKPVISGGKYEIDGVAAEGFAVNVSALSRMREVTPGE